MAVADARVGLTKRGKSAAGNKPSLLIALLIFIIHLVAIGLLLNDRAVKPEQNSEVLIQSYLLPSDKRTYNSPAIAPYQPLPSTAITVSPPQSFVIELKTSADSRDKAEFSGQSDSGIFDPRLRKKLSDLNSRTATQSSWDVKSWTDASGTRIVEVKPGECIRAMPDDGNTRGDNWSLRFKCGKSNGERMMDNVNADMAERNKSSHDKP